MINAIEAHRLNFGYQEMILEDVSFSVTEGECLGIIGPNGGGKTTLLKLLLGLLRPSSGEIRIYGHRPRMGKESIAYVPQSIHFDRLFPISVFDLVLTGRLAHLPWYGQYTEQDRAIVQKTICQMGLEEVAKAPFSALSGGQLQRALIARALASEPKILFLDEPTANVDATAEATVYQYLQQIKGSITILMVTHDLKTSFDLFDRLLCVQHEAIAIRPEEVCEHYTLGLYHKPLRTRLKP